MYLLEAFETHGVELAFQKLGVEGVHVSFEARNIYLPTLLGLHFVPEVKHSVETRPIRLEKT